MGWSAVTAHMKEAQERQEAFKNGEYNKPRIFPLIVKSGQEAAPVSFIPNANGEVEPVTLMVHTLPKAGGKGFTTRKCTGNGCKDCAAGDKAKFRAFFTVVDHRVREFQYTKGDKAGQKDVAKDTIAYYECSAANADMLYQKYLKAAKKQKLQNLTEAAVEISKYGSGTSTTTSYEFEPRADTTYQIPEGAAPIDFDELFAPEGTSTGSNTTTPSYE